MISREMISREMISREMISREMISSTWYLLPSTKLPPLSKDTLTERHAQPGFDPCPTDWVPTLLATDLSEAGIKVGCSHRTTWHSPPIPISLTAVVLLLFVIFAIIVLFCLLKYLQYLFYFVFFFIYLRCLLSFAF